MWISLRLLQAEGAANQGVLHMTPLEHFMKCVHSWPGDWYPEVLREDQTNGTLTNLSIYTALLTMGGMRPSGYGVIRSGGPYDRHGLEQDEFLWMVETNSWIQGYLAAKPEEAQWFQNEVHQELLKRVPQILSRSTHGHGLSDPHEEDPSR